MDSWVCVFVAGHPQDNFCTHTLAETVYDGKGREARAAFLHLGNNCSRLAAVQDWVRTFYGPDVCLRESGAREGKENKENRGRDPAGDRRSISWANIARKERHHSHPGAVVRGALQGASYKRRLHTSAGPAPPSGSLPVLPRSLPFLLALFIPGGIQCFSREGERTAYHLRVSQKVTGRMEILHLIPY